MTRDYHAIAFEVYRILHLHIEASNKLNGRRFAKNLVTPDSYKQNTIIRHIMSLDKTSA